MAWLTRLSWLLGGKDIEANIVIVGLNGSGKSTVMRQLKPHEVSHRQRSQARKMFPNACSFWGSEV